MYRHRGYTKLGTNSSRGVIGLAGSVIVHFTNKLSSCFGVIILTSVFVLFCFVLGSLHNFLQRHRRTANGNFFTSISSPSKKEQFDS